jgi:tripartite motif-containing protein 71
MKTTILRAFFTILTLTCFLYPSISYSEDYVFERQWPEILGLRRPVGITVDSSGNVYVVDVTIKYNSSGNVLLTIGGNGSGIGQFNHPSGVAIDSLGNVYVADVGNSNIQKFDSNGTYITKWGVTGLSIYSHLQLAL